MRIRFSILTLSLFLSILSPVVTLSGQPTHYLPKSRQLTIDEMAEIVGGVTIKCKKCIVVRGGAECHDCTITL